MVRSGIVEAIIVTLCDPIYTDPCLIRNRHAALAGNGQEKMTLDSSGDTSLLLGRDGVPTVLVSLHSFTPVYAGVARPWHIGTLYHRDTRLPPLLLEQLRTERDLLAGDNEPYAVSDDTDYT